MCKICHYLGNCYIFTVLLLVEFEHTMSKGREVILPGDRYVFEDSVVGEGAQGKVHLGYDLTNNDRIAIKVSIYVFIYFTVLELWLNLCASKIM